MNTTAIGRQAESAAARYLANRHGYEVVEHNWRTRWCEIDLVAKKGDSVMFIEVKYRRRSLWGSGLDYITPEKYKQMSFAAELWMAKNHWSGLCHLAAIEVSGPEFEVSAFMPEI